MSALFTSKQWEANVVKDTGNTSHCKGNNKRGMTPTRRLSLCMGTLVVTVICCSALLPLVSNCRASPACDDPFNNPVV